MEVECMPLANGASSAGGCASRCTPPPDAATAGALKRKTPPSGDPQENPKRHKAEALGPDSLKDADHTAACAGAGAVLHPMGACDGERCANGFDPTALELDAALRKASCSLAAVDSTPLSDPK